MIRVELDEELIHETTRIAFGVLGTDKEGIKPDRLDIALALFSITLQGSIIQDYICALANFYYNNPTAREFVEQEIHYKELP